MSNTDKNIYMQNIMKYSIRISYINISAMTENKITFKK